MSDDVKNRFDSILCLPIPGMDSYHFVHCLMDYGIAETVYNHYEGNRRHYHNWEHIKEGLNVMVNMRIFKHDVSNNFRFETVEQLIAWLCHDILYIPGYHGNEEASAELTRHLFREGFPGVDYYLVKKIILDTKTHTPSCEESKVVLDLDMYRLSVPTHEHMRNANNVLLEFQSMGLKPDDFRKGRSQFIQDLLKQDDIYWTEYAKKHWEELARKNLEIELAEYI